MNDLKPFKHGDEGKGSTHYVCEEIKKVQPKDLTCCGCTKHKCKKK